jgi:hypothetical protein
MIQEIDGAKRRAYLYLTELEQAVDVRQLFIDIIIGRLGELRECFKYDKAVLSRLGDALKLKGTPASALYRGLFIQANSIFEAYVREISSIVVDNIASKASRYSQLSETFRHQHIASSGRILREINTGSLTHHKVNFDKLTKSLGTCFSDVENFSLAPEVFTLTIGNITPDRLEDLFKKLKLQPPFEPGVGRSSAIQKALGEARRQQAAALAREKLQEIVRKRNVLVHGDSDLAIERSDLNETLIFLKAMIDALGDLARESTIST